MGHMYKKDESLNAYLIYLVQNFFEVFQTFIKHWVAEY